MSEEITRTYEIGQRAQQLVWEWVHRDRAFVCLSLLQGRRDLQSLRKVVTDERKFCVDRALHSIEEVEDFVLSLGACADLHGPCVADALDALHTLGCTATARQVAAVQHAINDPAVRAAVLQLTGGRCAYCDCQLEQGTGTTEAFTIEHIVPRESGGPDNIANYVPACKSCNCSKGTSHVVTFIKRRVSMAGGARPDLRVVTGEA